MKISLLLPSFGDTGYHVNTIRLAKGLRDCSHDVDIVVMSNTGSRYRHLICSEVNIVDLHSPRLWTSLFPLAKYLRRNKPDVLISAAPLANGIAGWAKRFTRSHTTLIMTERGLKLFGFADEGSFKRRLLARFLRHGYREADAVVAVSRGVADELRTLKEVPLARIHVIYNPVWSRELEARSRCSVDYPRLSENSDRPLIVAAGRLAEEKGFDTLLRAVALVRAVRDVRLIVLGEGKERPALAALASELHLDQEVDFPGFKDDPQLYMRRASVFVMTSRREAFGNVLVEALACGTPVVSTDCPTGPREILDDGKYGTLVPVDNPDALAAAILSTLAAPVDRSVLKERAKVFSVETATRKYLELIAGMREHKASV